MSKFIDGVKFNDDGTVIIKYPSALTAETYIVPPEVVVIKDSAFWGHPYIKKVVCNEGLKRIGNNAFGYSALKEIILPKSIEEIGCCAFKATNIRDIYIPAVPKILGEDILCRDKTCIIPPIIRITLEGTPKDWSDYKYHFFDPFDNFTVTFTSYDGCENYDMFEDEFDISPNDGFDDENDD